MVRKKILITLVLLLSYSGVHAADYRFTNDTTGTTTRQVTGNLSVNGSKFHAAANGGTLDSMIVWFYSNSGGANDSIQAGVYDSASTTLVGSSSMTIITANSSFNRVVLSFGHSGTVVAGSHYWVVLRIKSTGSCYVYAPTVQTAIDSGIVASVTDADPLNTTLAADYRRAGDFSSEYYNMRSVIWYSSGAAPPATPTTTVLRGSVVRGGVIR